MSQGLDSLFFVQSELVLPLIDGFSLVILEIFLHSTQISEYLIRFEYALVVKNQCCYLLTAVVILIFIIQTLLVSKELLSLG